MTEPQPQKEYIWNRAPSRHGGYVYDIYQTGDHILIAFTKEKAIEIVGVLNNSSAKESSDLLDELERNMVSYFDTGYASADLKFIGDCFEKYRQQKERERR